MEAPSSSAPRQFNSSMTISPPPSPDVARRGCRDARQGERAQARISGAGCWRGRPSAAFRRRRRANKFPSARWGGQQVEHGSTRLREVKWGALGIANIAVEKVIPAMQRAEYNTQIAGMPPAGTWRKARAAADKPGIARAFGSCESARRRRDQKPIYNPLPDRAWMSPWTLRALKAGKHVLCEKPIALDADQAHPLIKARKHSGKLVAEAFMVRYRSPVKAARRDLCRDWSGWGPRARSRRFFSYRLLDPENVRNRLPGIQDLRHRRLRHPDGALYFRRCADARSRDAGPRPEFSDRPVGERDTRISRRT